MKLVITYLQGSLANTRSEIGDPLLYIGRDPSQCRIVFGENDAGVSRRHAEIRLHNESLVLTDLQSTYGTFVNNYRIDRPVLLTPGCIVQFGQGGPVIRIDSFEPHGQVTVSEAPQTPPVSSVAGVNSSPNAIPAASPPVQPMTRPPSGMPGPVSQGGGNQPPASVRFTPSAEPQPLLSSTPSIPPSAPPSLSSPPSNAGNGPVTVSVYLELLNGNRTEQFKLMTSGTMLLGREETNQIRLDPTVFPTVSRRHAEIQARNGEYLLCDLGSFNGTLLDGQRIASPTPLRHGNRIQLGFGGPEFRFVNPTQAAAMVIASAHEEGAGTVIIRGQKPVSSAAPGERRQFVVRKEFTKDILTLGRSSDTDLQLDVLQISKHHARFVRQGGTVTVEDTGSTNGVYVNGQRVSRCQVRPNDLVQIGPYTLQVDASGIVVFDSRSQSRIDVIDLTKEVKNRDGSGMIKLLDRIRLSIPANEFVGLIGPSGAGKSTLMDALNGMRPADQGTVLVNNLNLYENINSFKQSIGYVPQDDIIHRELTVYRTLYYVAKMRLSSDTSNAEIDNIINEVLDVTGLTSRRNVPISQLSGGQRKRVSIAVELITKPSIIFLDEPTSGLDPGTEEKIMQLFRQISEAGHSVVLTTHAMENVKLFDKLVVMMRGRLVWYGPPQECLEYFGINSIKHLFDTLGDPNSDQVAIGWQRKFEQSTAYQKYIIQPLSGLQRLPAQPPRKATNDNTLWQSIRQMFVLARRYFEVMWADKFNLLILLGQAPVIALLMGLAVGNDWTRDFPYFILALSSLWFGCSNAAREIVKESNVYKRERMVNLGILPYIFSKLIVLVLIGMMQCALLYGVGALVESVPGNPVLIYFCMLFSTMTGIGIGLLISAAVRTSEVATSLVPLILIPQILFGGLVLPNKGPSEAIGFAMPAMWSYDLLKHISDLDVMRGINDEYDEDGKIGRVKAANDRAIKKFEDDLENYREEEQEKLTDYKRRADNAMYGGGGNPGPMPSLGDPPKAPKIEYPPDDKSEFVGFRTTYGSIPLNFAILGVFFVILLILTGLVLKSKDVL